MKSFSATAKPVTKISYFPGPQAGGDLMIPSEGTSTMFHDLAIRSRGDLQRPSPQRGGFTLVELMVVIAIICILMGLLTPVIYRAMNKAQETRILAELVSLDGGIKAFKERYGMYPPSDFSNMTVSGPVGLFLARAFPRCNIATELTWITTYGGGATLSPAQALVFWLQGFSSDAEHPLSALNAATPVPATPLFPFDNSRLIFSTGGSANPVLWQRFAVYAPQNGQSAPYVYCASQNYATQLTFPGTWTAQGGAGACRPYYLDTIGNGSGSVPVTYVNPSSFQIISAGLDGNYGAGACSYPSGAAYVNATTSGGPPGTLAYAVGDLDNLTNFPTGNNLGDSVPLNQ